MDFWECRFSMQSRWKFFHSADYKYDSVSIVTALITIPARASEIVPLHQSTHQVPNFRRGEEKGILGLKLKSLVSYPRFLIITPASP